MRNRQPHARAKFGDPNPCSSSEIRGEANWYFIIRYLIILDVTLGISIKFVYYILPSKPRCACKYNKVPDDKVPICSPLNFGRTTRLGITKFGTRMWLTIMHHPVQKSFEKSKKNV